MRLRPLAIVLLEPLQQLIVLGVSEFVTRHSHRQQDFPISNGWQVSQQERTHADGGSRQLVRLNPCALRTDRGKAAIGISLPESGQWSTRTPDPLRTVEPRLG
jgi:hypothetical protein